MIKKITNKQGNTMTIEGNRVGLDGFSGEIMMIHPNKDNIICPEIFPAQSPLITFGEMKRMQLNGVMIEANAMAIVCDHICGDEFTIVLCNFVNNITILKTNTDKYCMNKYRLKVGVGFDKVKIDGVVTKDQYITLDIVENPKQFGGNPEETKKNFPLWKVEFEQSMYGRDGGSEWADPYNDIRRSGSVCYYVRKDMDSYWEKVYSHGAGDFSYASHKAALTLPEVQMQMDNIPRLKKASMFSVDGTMFKNPHYCEGQLCVCGDAIEGESFYNDYEGDRSTKRDMLASCICSYDKNEIAIAHGKVYFNAEIICTKEDLKEHGIQYYQLENNYPTGALETLCTIYPVLKEATSYDSWQGSGGFKWEEEKSMKRVEKFAKEMEIRRIKEENKLLIKTDKEEAVLVRKKTNEEISKKYKKIHIHKHDVNYICTTFDNKLVLVGMDGKELTQEFECIQDLEQHVKEEEATLIKQAEKGIDHGYRQIHFDRPGGVPIGETVNNTFIILDDEYLPKSEPFLTLQDSIDSISVKETVMVTIRKIEDGEAGEYGIYRNSELVSAMYKSIVHLAGHCGKFVCETFDGKFVIVDSFGIALTDHYDIFEGVNDTDVLMKNINEDSEEICIVEEEPMSNED